MSEPGGPCLSELRDRAVQALRCGGGEAIESLLHELLLLQEPLAKRYREVDVESVLRHNELRQGLNAIVTAFNILEKYGRNLLSTTKPKFWRAVKFNNPVFKSTVDAIKGGRDILYLYGYTVRQPDGVTFPEDVLEPDSWKVAAVTAEVAMLQIELGLLCKGTHPHPEIFHQFLPSCSQDAVPSNPNAPIAGISVGSPGARRVPNPQVMSPGSAGGTVMSEGRAGAVTASLPLQGVSGMSCAVCSTERVVSHCRACGLVFCRDCDGLYHRHPSRECHHREFIQGQDELSAAQERPGWEGDPSGPSQDIEEGARPGSLSPKQLAMEPVICRPAGGPWTCPACLLDNGLQVVLCLGCQRPRDPSPSPTSFRGPWCCQACTYHNQASSVLCSACDRPRLAGRPSFALRPNPVQAPRPHPLQDQQLPFPTPSQGQSCGWQCPHCTYINTGSSRVCDMCNLTSEVPEGEAMPPGTPTAGVMPPRTPVAGGGRGVGELAEAERQRELRESGLQLVNAIRMAEEHMIPPEEVACALFCSRDVPPLSWLDTELPHVLETISELVVRDGQELGLPEAPIQALMSMGFTDQEEGFKALYVNGGDVDKAVVDLQRRLLEPFHVRMWQEDEVSIQVDQPDKERVLRQLLATYSLPSWGRAEIVLSLMQEGSEHIQIQDAVEAVKQSQDREFIKRSLSLTCLICYSLYPRSKMQSLTSCECNICQECFKTNFTLAVREKHIKDLVCPCCSKPDIDDEAQWLSYFSTLDVQLRDCLDEDVYHLFHKKLTERTLMTDPNFKWCTHCSNGFIYDGNQSRVTCPQCHGSFCVDCKRPWEPQHQGISCEDFQNWKRENDPEYQAQGLAAYLKENGIDCPNCKFRYALARGGCMHFTCSQCQHQFCSGCYNTFLGKKKCPDPTCLLKDSLHAHHPRDCLSYLRDWEVARLQSLLQNNGVNFDTEHPLGVEETLGGRCRVMQQREEQGRVTDEACGNEVCPGGVGLCESHYKEYLVSRINGHSLDPAQLFTVGEMEICLSRCGKPQAARGQGEDEGQYWARLLKVISSIPLGDKMPRYRK
ncbi:E3 ubiquitin-protein ligase RNF31-like isoform X2 [Narcine bancroftii]|uniref:E3 ubiquitin-protein ligase RNF31-like isoform X2 n=1 Tax=Narcine bancroftii TaxID=1343680 RepID=UPI00383225C5